MFGSWHAKFAQPQTMKQKRTEGTDRKLRKTSLVISSVQLLYHSNACLLFFEIFPALLKVLHPRGKAGLFVQHTQFSTVLTSRVKALIKGISMLVALFSAFFRHKTLHLLTVHLLREKHQQKKKKTKKHVKIMHNVIQ